MKPPTKPAMASVEAGLCSSCRHRRIITSRRGSRFYRCERSAADPAYPRYPRLPQLVCPGYEPEPRGGRIDEPPPSP